MGGGEVAGRSFDAYVRRRWDYLVRSAVLLGATGQGEAEDVVQTTLLSCSRAWDRISQADDVDAYVHRSLINAARRHIRKSSNHRPLDDSEHYSVQSHESAYADRDAVDRALSRLPAEQRAVVVLRFYSDLSQEQIAKTLRIRVGTVKSRLSRACAALAKDTILLEMRTQ